MPLYLSAPKQTVWYKYSDSKTITVLDKSLSVWVFFLRFCVIVHVFFVL